MNLYPAIDLFEGKVVRLRKGDFRQMTVYHDRPSETARLWEDAGAKWLHLVNLNGARDGKLDNLTALRSIRRAANCKIQFGGGVRTLDHIRTLLDAGVERVILGSRALERRFLESALEMFPYHMAVGLDVMDGWVRTHGWLAQSSVRLESALRDLSGQSLAALIITDIQRDGMLAGPNFQMIENCLKSAKTPIILSGGITDLNDIRTCAQIKDAYFDGAIIGKAIYEKKFHLKEAFDVLKKESRL